MFWIHGLGIMVSGAEFNECGYVVEGLDLRVPGQVLRVHVQERKGKKPEKIDKDSGPQVQVEGSVLNI